LHKQLPLIVNAILAAPGGVIPFDLIMGLENLSIDIDMVQAI
jgi:hypothetical protein